MAKKYTPGLIPWIALLFLLFYMVNTMNSIVDHLTLIQIEVLESEIWEEDEEEEWFQTWDEMDQEDKEDRLRIALEAT